MRTYKYCENNITMIIDMGLFRIECGMNHPNVGYLEQKIYTQKKCASHQLDRCK